MQLFDVFSAASVQMDLRVGRELDEYIVALSNRGAALEGEYFELRPRVMEQTDPAVVTTERKALLDRFSALNKELKELDEVFEELEAREKNPSGTVLSGVSMVMALDEQGREVVTMRRKQSPEDQLKRLGDPLSPEAQNLHVSAVKGFVRDLIVPQGICPYTASSEKAAIGTALKKQGIEPGPVLYPCSAAVRPEFILRDFFVAADELLHTPDGDASTTLLIVPNFEPANFKQFAAFTVRLGEIIERSGLADEVGLVPFHPLYNRDEVVPENGLVGGHLPPQLYLQTYFLKYLENDAWQSNLQEYTKASNFARRAPQPVFNILRKTHLDAVQTEALFPQERVYATNAARLGGVGSETLAGMLKDWQEHI